jgi:hypothetical protein
MTPQAAMRMMTHQLMAEDGVSCIWGSMGIFDSASGCVGVTGFFAEGTIGVGDGAGGSGTDTSATLPSGTGSFTTNSPDKLLTFTVYFPLVSGVTLKLTVSLLPPVRVIYLFCTAVLFIFKTTL